MQSLLSVVAAASFAFVGTMFDNFFAFASQLVATPSERHARVSWAHAISITVLVVIAAGVGSVLTSVPIRLVSFLAIAPWALAWHAFKHPVVRQQHRRGIVTTFVLTFSLGGDNIAVWVPLLRANGLNYGLLAVATFAAWELIFVLFAQALAGRERVVAWGERFAPRVVPWLYIALGFVILVECRAI